jgi:hypothetical protein
MESGPKRERGLGTDWIAAIAPVADDWKATPNSQRNILILNDKRCQVRAKELLSQDKSGVKDGPDTWNKLGLV